MLHKNPKFKVGDVISENPVFFTTLEFKPVKQNYKYHHLILKINEPKNNNVEQMYTLMQLENGKIRNMYISYVEIVMMAQLEA